MPRTSTPKSPSERYARLVAKAFAKGRAPSQTRGLQDFIFRNDAAVFETLEGIVAHLASARGSDAALTHGYLYLLQAQLENLRFQRDRGYDLADRHDRELSACRGDPRENAPPAGSQHWRL